MKLKDIFTDCTTAIFVVIDSSPDNELDWIIEPTPFELIPDEENTYYVKGKQVSETSITDCIIGIEMPDRIAESVLKLNKDGQVIVESIVYQYDSVIAAMASESYGDYYLYYSIENPQIGIDILTTGMAKATNKAAMAEDLAYIFREEGRLEEAIEYFQFSEQAGPSSVYIYRELFLLYKQLGQADKESYYHQKFVEGGGM
jgi:tetratricopeptide (TPR) repeat protein